MDKLNRRDIREKTQILVDSLDQQKLDNMAIEFARQRVVEEYNEGIRLLDNHALCQGNVKLECEKSREVVNQVESCVQTPKQEIHGEDCHCSKCCPNPNPTWFQKNRNGVLLTILWVAMIILAIGWSPSGKTFEAIQTSYVELIVDFFKMGIFAIAGLVTYRLVKDRK